jgi:hypothetical protein
MYLAFAMTKITDKFRDVGLYFSQYFYEVPYQGSNFLCC